MCWFQICANLPSLVKTGDQLARFVRISSFGKWKKKEKELMAKIYLMVHEYYLVKIV